MPTRRKEKKASAPLEQQIEAALQPGYFGCNLDRQPTRPRCAQGDRRRRVDRSRTGSTSVARKAARTVFYAGARFSRMSLQISMAVPGGNLLCQDRLLTAAELALI
ncbi:MAG: hypothetical protein ACRD3J_07495 [Thermoanaerobaculia bacterium]